MIRCRGCAVRLPGHTVLHFQLAGALMHSAKFSGAKGAFCVVAKRLSIPAPHMTESGKGCCRRGLSPAVSWRN